MAPRAVSGFTIVELSIIALLMAVFAAIALPKFLAPADPAVKSGFGKHSAELVDSLDLVKAAYLLEETGELPPDVNNDFFPDHLGDLGNPNTMQTFFSGILDQPLENSGYGAANSGPGWKSTDGWLPSGSRYYYYYDGDGNGLYSSAVDSRIYYDSDTGRIIQDAWGAGTI